MRVVLGSWLYSLLYPLGAPLHNKGQKQASKDVTTAAVNLVSIIHVTIVVSVTANSHSSSRPCLLQRAQPGVCFCQAPDMPNKPQAVTPCYFFSMFSFAAR